MGVYDIVGELGIQVKCTPDPSMHSYNIGDSIPLTDGLYIGREGWFIVHYGRMFMEGKDIYTKWGGKLLAKDILKPDDYIAGIIKKLDE